MSPIRIFDGFSLLIGENPGEKGNG
jgi:hypothetical protein